MNQEGPQEMWRKMLKQRFLEFEMDKQRREEEPERGIDETKGCGEMDKDRWQEGIEGEKQRVSIWNSAL